MASKKRGRQAGTYLVDDEDVLTILLAPADTYTGPKQELRANMHIVRSCCSCGGGLPKDAAEWDLSTLLVGGEPVQRATVVAWLNCAYVRITDEEYEPQQQHDDDERSTVAGLARLLAFADAIGSQRGIIAACADMQQELQLVVTLPKREGDSNTTLRLLTDGGAYSLEPYPFDSDINPADLDELLYCSASEQYSLGPLLPFEDELDNRQAAELLVEAVAQQAEALLFEAQRLDLHDLTYHLLRFVASCAHRPSCILFGRLGDVFTDRLMDAALLAGYTQASEDAWFNSVMCMPCSFVSGPCLHQLFHVPPAPPSAAYLRHHPGAPPLPSPTDPLRFTATLCEDLAGASVGDKVNVELDLFRTSTIRIGKVSRKVQLLLGNPILCDQDREDLLSSGLGRFSASHPTP